MNDLTLILSSLKSRWLNSTLSVFLTAFGVMLSILIIQFSVHVDNRINADGKDVDVVIGAKGSPLQIVLSSIYHIDIPTGNIPWSVAQRWMGHRFVKTAVPIALGDNWGGYRLVGTTEAYMDHYNADLADGRIWTKEFEAVAGASTGLKIGDSFVSSHGLIPGGEVHENARYEVVGIIEHTGTVLDRLILTSIDSILLIHGLEALKLEQEKAEQALNPPEETEEETEDETEEDQSALDHEHPSEPEITAILITTKSPLANINLPRSVNRQSDLQAATPALEIVRLTSMLGLGSKSFAALSMLLIAIAVLSIFAGLAGSLENRMGDLAVLRAIGYSKKRIFKIIALEGMMIVIAGIVLGFLMGVAGFNVMSQIVTPLGATGASIHYTFDLILIFALVIIAGFIATSLPALRASRVDVARQLSNNA